MIKRVAGVARRVQKIIVRIRREHPVMLEHPAFALNRQGRQKQPVLTLQDDSAVLHLTPVTNHFVGISGRVIRVSKRRA